MTDPASRQHDPTYYGPPAGEDLLPPVEPPSAGFLIQLFVVPALIVILIVAAWLAVIPRLLRDVFDHVVARTRYRLWGRRDEVCPIIPPSLRVRFDP